MRWAVLYARSRRVPASFAAVVVTTAVVWVLFRDWGPQQAMLALTAAVAVAAIGLSGQDPDLDRAAALPWPRRRLAHLALIGAVSAGAVLVLRQLSPSSVDLSIIIRDAGGLLGLAGLAATAAGGQFGWTVPIAWSAIALFVPKDGTAAGRIAAWMLQPAGTTVATWTAAILTIAGTAAYAGWGGRR